MCKLQRWLSEQVERFKELSEKGQLQAGAICHWDNVQKGIVQSWWAESTAVEYTEQELEEDLKLWGDTTQRKRASFRYVGLAFLLPSNGSFHNTAERWKCNHDVFLFSAWVGKAAEELLELQPWTHVNPPLTTNFEGLVMIIPIIITSPSKPHCKTTQNKQNLACYLLLFRFTSYFFFTFLF